MNWLLIVGLAPAGLLADRLGRAAAAAAEEGKAARTDDPQRAYMLFWLDQYGWIGLTLLGLGVLSALAGVLR